MFAKFSPDASRVAYVSRNNIYVESPVSYTHLDVYKRQVQYGDAFDKVNDGPYDYFTARATFGLSGNQPLISQINLMGKLWGLSLIHIYITNG